jgi:peptide/nickel transport system permease protein
MAEPRDGAAESKSKSDAAEQARHERANALVKAGQKSSRRRMPRALSSLFANKLATFGAIMLILVAFAAIFAPVIAPFDPNEQNLIDNRQPGFWSTESSGSYILGTDSLGRDIFSRILYGAQISLLVGMTAVALAGAIGITLGLVSGFYGRFVDDVIMRIADIQLAIPFILLAIAILAVLGQGLQNVILTLGIANWVVYGRVVRGQVLSWKEKEFVEAARSIGARDISIMLKHILPNTFASIIVIASFAVAATILAEAALSFLGLGVPPSIPTWGGMVNRGRDNILTGEWWIYTFPGLAIMLTVLSVNVIGDWLRDYLDPRMRV